MMSQKRDIIRVTHMSTIGMTKLPANRDYVDRRSTKYNIELTLSACTGTGGIQG